MPATVAQKKALVKARKVKKAKHTATPAQKAALRKARAVKTMTASGDGFFGDLVSKAWNAGKQYLQKNRTISTALLRAAPGLHDRVSPHLGNAVGHLGGLVRRNTAYGRTAAPGLKRLAVGSLH